MATTTKINFNARFCSGNEASIMEDAAFKAFMKVMQRYHLFFHVLNEMAMFNEKLKGHEAPSELLNGFLPPLCIKMDWKAIKNGIKSRINNNIENMGRCNSNYDYLVHCVNTMIQIFIENGLMKKDERIELPRFEELGAAIFQLAGEKVFSKDFANYDDGSDDEGKPCMPRNEEESKFVAKLLNHLILEEHCDMRAATAIVSQRLRAYRMQEENDHRNQYVDYADDMAYGEENDDDFTDMWDDDIWEDD